MINRTRRTPMGIEEEIFEEFFNKLEENEEVPVDVIIELRQLLESGDVLYKENIIEAIDKGANNGD